MSTTINSANMTLPVPVVGSDPGPQYATDINSCLTIIDGHDHSTGSGVPINPTGLNINSDLTFNNNDAYSLRSVRFQTQASPLALASDIGCLYESGVDLYYNDGLGNQIRITQSGGITGTPGSISNLTPPATANYVAGNQTFVWQSAVNTPANLDAGFIILRNNSAGSKGLTLQPPAAMASDYTITLPALPSTQSFVTLDASGAMSAPWTVDGTSIVITGNQIKLGSLANTIDTPDIIDHAVTQIKLGAANYAQSLTGIGFHETANSTGSYLPLIGPLTTTITTTGRPVSIRLQGDGSTNLPILSNTGSGASDMRFLRDGTVIYTDITVTNRGLSAYQFIDYAVTAGVHVYEIEFRRNSGTIVWYLEYLDLVAQEY